MKDETKQKITTVIKFLLIIIVLGVSILFLDKKILKDNVKDIDWIRKNVNIVKDNSLGKNIYRVKKDDNISIYNLKFQQVVDEKINTFIESMKDDYIVFYNPYGTNELSVNVYFKESESFNDLKYTVKSSNKNINDFSKTLVDKDDKSAYQLIGLSPEEENKVSIDISTNDKNKSYSFNINLEKEKVLGEKKLKVENGESTEELSNGLFAMLGNDSDEKDYLALYDNDGILRSETPIIGYRAHRILFDDDKMYFSISQTRIAEINNLGRVTKIYRTGNYQLHHDYTFDKDGNILILANNTKKETEEDCIIKIDRKTGKVTELVDFEDIFKSYVETCTLDTKSQRDEGEDGLDWLHLNSIEYVDGDVFLSSRETSSIIKVSNILENPKVEYILSNKEFWKDTEFADLVFNRVGDFKIHAGQHSVRYIKGEEDGEFYLTFFDNNYGVSNSQPNFDYKTVGIENNNPFKGDESYYYVYKVNENEKTFELVDSFPVEYSGIVSSVQTMSNNNVITDSGTQGIFAEYDKEHNLIRKYTAKMNKYMVYRVLKYDFNNFWFK